MDWRDEMDKMLAAFDRQARLSLGKMRIAFNRSGLSFNSKFKQYFLEASNARLEQTYNQFKLNFQLEEDIRGNANTSTSRPLSYNTDGINSTQAKIELENQNRNIIEIDDSSDEEGVTHTSIKLIRETALQIVPPDNILGTSVTPICDRLKQSIDSSTLAKSANDINTFRIGSTVIRCRSDVRAGTGGREKCGGSDTVENAIIVPASKSNAGTTSTVRNPINIEGQNSMLNEVKDKVGVNNLLVEGINAPIGNQRNTNASLANKGPQVNHIKITNGIENAVERSTRHKFKCTVCQYSSKNKAHLNRHIRTHTGERPYRCNRCEKGFTTEQNLKMHAVTHIDVFPFHCKGCFRGFSLKIEKQAHDKVCEKRRYECHLCKKFTTKRKNNLKKHMQSHTGEQPFRCEICMMRFPVKRNLRNHLNNIHTRSNL